MAYPKTLRKQLGISLEDFATLINCNAGQLSMAESGKRNLPTASTTITTVFEQLVTQTEDTDLAENVSDEKTQAMLYRHINTCEAKLQMLLLQQENLTEKILQLKRLLLVAPMAVGNPIIAGNEDIALQLQVLQRKAQKKLGKYGLQSAELIIAIAEIKAGITAAKELLPH